MADKSAPPGQARLMMWSTPRSGSTAFTKCISFVEDSLIFAEPYLAAHWFGPDGVKDAAHQEKAKDFLKEASEKSTITRGFDATQSTYKWVKELLEEPHIGKKLLFNKDVAFSISDNLEFLPKGYRHMFLARNPLRVFSSWKKLYQLLHPEDFQLDEIAPALFPRGLAFSEMSKVLDHVQMTQDQAPIIIDTDDLLSDPRGILSALFKEIGLPFDEKILEWEAGDAVTEQWFSAKVFLQGNQVWPYYKNAFASTHFMKPGELPDRSSLPDDVIRCVDACMPYYEKMYAQRLIPK